MSQNTELSFGLCEAPVPRDSGERLFWAPKICSTWKHRSAQSHRFLEGRRLGEHGSQFNRRSIGSGDLDIWIFRRAQQGSFLCSPGNLPDLRCFFVLLRSCLRYQFLGWRPVLNPILDSGSSLEFLFSVAHEFCMTFFEVQMGMCRRDLDPKNGACPLASL